MVPKAPFQKIRLALIVPFAALLGGCQEATASPTAPSRTSGPVATRDLDSMCKTVRSPDGSSPFDPGSQAVRSCLERFVGNWALDSSALPDLEAALDSSVAPYPEDWRPTVRKRLRSVARVPVRLSVGLLWPRVVVASDGGAGDSSRPDGIEVPFDDGGETIRRATRLEAGQLVQSFQAVDGLRKDAYSVSKDGQNLFLTETTSGDGMQVPLRITMRYRRR